ncbi:MAG TPA: DUF4249 domain-containing protein [Puia sp.]|nr:DUF4249 domain-containing protein [Puia sp.]
MGSTYYFLHDGKWIPLVLCCCLCRCVQPYVSPYKSPPTGYLVVEGYISANTPTQYKLTRTVQLSGNYGIPVVTGAAVQVVGSDSSQYALPEQGNGVYGNTTLNLNPALQYRLQIQTPNGESYQSDFVPLKPSPPIDSINWVYSADSGVNIYINTHDPNNSTRYYQWSYDQTWEYDMPEISYLIYDDTNNTVVPRLPGQEVNRCWVNSPSTNLLIDNTNKLSQDVVYQFPLVNIPIGSQQLMVLYSLQVTQYALTAAGYNFLYLMQQNTEALGSIFDAQPTEVIGNIHCLNNPAEQVIGYISAGTVQQERFWIASYQLPVYWQYFITCPGPPYVVPNSPDSLKYYFGGGGYTPLEQGGVGYVSEYSTCVNCLLLGGLNQKPSFWPN